MASTVDPHAPESPASSPMAAIDLGTNTILMVVGRRIRDDLAQDDQVEILDDAHVIARMGKGVDKVDNGFFPFAVDNNVGARFLEEVLSFRRGAMPAENIITWSRGRLCNCF